MRSGKLTLLVLAALVAALAAVLLTRDDSADGDDGGLLFPGLLDRVNDVAVVRAVGPNGPLAVTRDAGGWRVDVLGDYAADPAVVGKVVRGLARLTVLQAMTARPENHAKLGVQAPGATPLESAPDGEVAPGATGPIGLTLEDAGGQVLADVIVGQARTGQPPALYVRRAGEDQAWLVGGELAPPPLAAGWVDAQIMDLGPDRFRRATITHADGEVVTVARTAESDTEWGLLGLPEGRKETWAGVGRSVGGALQQLEFDDVRAAARFAWPSAEVTDTRWLGFDGFVVEAQTVPIDGQTWTRFAAATEFVDPLPPEAPESAPAADDAAPEAPPVSEISERDLEIARRERLQAEAEAFNQRHGPWIYALPEWKATNLLKRMADLTKAADPPTPPAAPFEPDADPAGMHIHDDG